MALPNYAKANNLTFRQKWHTILLMRRTKKIFITALATFLLFENSIITHAAHAHSENCYIVQEVHTHTGNSANGGGCYGIANYHVHSGDSVNGGGCYGIANYHVHSGNTASGGACYATANYHVHSGDSTSGGGCYVEKTSTESGTCYIMEVVLNKTSWGCSQAGCTGTINHKHWSSYHSKCGQSGSTGKINICDTCGYTDGTPFHYSTHSYTINVVTYELGCGKSTDVAESYSLSCTKSTTTAESYTLSCGKTAETIESYSLNCGKEEGQVTRVLICTISQGSDAVLFTPKESPEAETSCKLLVKKTYLYHKDKKDDTVTLVKISIQPRYKRLHPVTCCFASRKTTSNF